MVKTQTSAINAVFGACKKALFFAVFFSLFINILMLTVPIYMLQILDRVLASQSYETLLYLSIIAIFALLMFGLLYIVRSHILAKMAEYLDIQLNPAALQRSPDEMLRGNTYAPHVMEDIRQIRGFIASNSIVALFDAPWLPIYLWVIFILNSNIGFVATFGAIILFSLAIANEYFTRALIASVNITASKNQFRMFAALRNVTTIQAMGMMPAILRNWHHENKETMHDFTQATNRSSTLLGISKFLRFSLQITVLGIGAYLVVQNQFTPGMMIAASILVARGLAPVELSISGWNQFIRSRQAYYRLQKYFSTKPPRQITTVESIPHGTLRAEGVSYAPPKVKKPVLFQISLAVHPGEVLAIVGPSAAGKTTLAALITGAIAPITGTIRLGNADIYTWEREDFGKHIGYIPQDVELFAGTIKENIARMKDVPKESVIDAAQWAGIHEMILSLANGYDTQLDESSSQLSMGQRQRVALARAYFNNPQLLILDEPDSYLDQEGEIALIKSLLKAKEKKRTTIIISHHPNIIKLADDVLYLKNGRVFLYGKRDAIVERLSKEQLGGPKDQNILKKLD